TATINVALGPYADLVTSQVSAPGLTVGDPARVTIGWTVTNQGTGATKAGTWRDEVIASPDAVAGNGDGTLLAGFRRNRGVPVGGHYDQSQTFLLPPAFHGRYHLFVRANADGAVFENSALANDAAEASQFFDVTLTPYADLVVSALSVPATATSGQTISLSWT